MTQSTKLSRMRHVAVTALVVGAFGLNACQTAEMQQLQSSLGLDTTTGQGCALGAGAGLLLGGLLSGWDGETMAWSTLGGAALGCSAGYILNERRKAAKSEVDFYDQQIAITRDTNQGLAQENKNLKAQLARNNKRIAALEKQRAAGQSTKAAAQKDYDRAVADAKKAEDTLAAAKKELEVQEAALKDFQKSPNEASRSRVRTLQTEVDTLRLYVQDLEKQSAEMASQRDALGQFI